MINAPVSFVPIEDTTPLSPVEYPGRISMYYSKSCRSFIMVVTFDQCEGELFVTLMEDPVRKIGLILRSDVTLPGTYDLPHDAVSVDWVTYRGDDRRRMHNVAFLVSAVIVRGFTKIVVTEHPSWPCPLDRSSVFAVLTSIFCDPLPQQGRVVVHYSTGSDWDTGIYGSVEQREVSGLKRWLMKLGRRLGIS